MQPIYQIVDIVVFYFRGLEIFGIEDTGNLIVETRVQRFRIRSNIQLGEPQTP